MFENSKWIRFVSPTPGKDSHTTPAPYIAKTFTLKEKPAKALLNICGLGDAAYFLNGKRIPDSIRPTHASHVTKTVIYNTFDLTNFLEKGRNRLGAILGCFRLYNSQYLFCCPPMLIVELDIEYHDGSCEKIVSDESFKGHDSSIIFTATCCGERQDARLEIPSWCNNDFDDSSWANVIIADAPNKDFRTTNCPPKRILGEHKFTEIAPKLFDCGITTAGYARMKITGKPGTLIKLNYSERLIPGENHVDRSAYTTWKYPDMYNSDEYILDGTPNKVFDQLMAFHGFRYVEVIGDYDDIELTAVTEHTDFRESASFNCDNDIINKIHAACVNSVLTCCQDVFVDNPKRDAPWIGDTMLSTEVIISEFDSREVLLENAKLCLDSINENGQLPYSIPSVAPWCFSKQFSGPDWGASVVFQTVLWIYKYYGDLAPFKEYRDLLDNILGFFKSIADDDGYIGDGEYATGDWSNLRSSVRGRNDIMSNVYYKWDLDIMAELSELCGYPRDVYDAESSKIRAAFRKRYMPDGVFKEKSAAELITLAAQGFFDKSEMPEIINRIVKSIENDNKIITFGVHGLKMMFKLLCDNGYGEFLYDVVTNTNGPGYAKNALDGLTALPERFDCQSREGHPEDGMMSMNHHFFCMVDTYFYRCLAGIMINDFATGDIVISPMFVSGINKLSAKLRGIEVYYDQTQLKITSPYAFKLILDNKTTLMPAGTHTINR